MFAYNRSRKRAFLPFLRMLRILCPLKASKLTDSGSLFFLTDDRRLDHCRNDWNREYRVRIFRERRPFHVAAPGMLDCVRDDHDFARPRPSAEKGDAATNRTRNR